MNKKKSELTQSLTLTCKDSSTKQNKQTKRVFPPKKRPNCDFGDPIIWMDDYWGCLS